MWPGAANRLLLILALKGLDRAVLNRCDEVLGCGDKRIGVARSKAMVGCVIDQTLQEVRRQIVSGPTSCILHYADIGFVVGVATAVLFGSVAQVVLGEIDNLHATESPECHSVRVPAGTGVPPVGCARHDVGVQPVPVAGDFDALAPIGDASRTIVANQRLPHFCAELSPSIRCRSRQPILLTKVIWNVVVENRPALHDDINVTVSAYVRVARIRALKIDSVVHSSRPVVSFQGRLDRIVRDGRTLLSTLA